MVDREAQTSDEVSPPRRRGRLALTFAVVVGLGLVGWIVMTRSDDAVVEEATELRFADVVRTDLVEESTFDGTLGRTAAEPTTAAFAGTVTASPSPGDQVVQGDILYEIDKEPVALLYGDVPMYRTLTASAEDVVIPARVGGTVTWVPEEGIELVEGDVIMRIDEEPIVLLYGNTPAYRTMADERTDIEGADVLQLEEALVRLGYDPDASISVDGTFTSATRSLVEDWQEAIEASETGRVNLGSVVFLSGPVQITSIEVTIGDVVGAGQPLLTSPGDQFTSGDDVRQLEAALAAIGYGDDLTVDGVFDTATTAAVIEFQTSLGMESDGTVDLGEIVFRGGPLRISERLTSIGGFVNSGGAVLAVTTSDIVITVDLPAADQNAISPGDMMTVELPDGTLVPAVVESIASVATVTQGQATFETTIRLDDPAAAGDLDEAPVEVHFVSDSVSNVMAVPVTSLLALREGGYAVEVRLSDGTTALVGVEPGFFAGGLVEVESSQLQVGAQVVIP